MGLLVQINDFDYISLFQRLENFYECWCEGEYIDAPPNENYPQKKMLMLKEELKDRDRVLGLRQVDVYTGLNIMILLLELHRYGQEREALKDKIAFYPCGKPNDEGKLEDSTKLLRIIGYSASIAVFLFRGLVREYLSKVFLPQATFFNVNLAYANLSGANLTKAYFSNAFLVGADLRDSNLKDVVLAATDLSGANLRNANLSGAKLSNTILGNKEDGDIIWDETTNWEGVRGLESAINVPDRLKQQLGLS